MLEVATEMVLFFTIQASEIMFVVALFPVLVTSALRVTMPDIKGLFGPLLRMVLASLL